MSISAEPAEGRPLRIAYVSPTGEARGGGEFSLLTLLKYLNRESVAPVVVCPESGSFDTLAAQIGVPVHCLPYAPLWRLPVSGVVKRWVQWMREEAIDIVHVNAAGRCLSIAGLAGRRLGIPVIWHARMANREPLADRWYGLLSTHIVATSAFVATRFAGTPDRRKVTVIRNAVNVDAFGPAAGHCDYRNRLGLSPDRVLVGLFGRLDKWKRFDAALEAFAAAQRVDERLFAVVIGDGPERGRLEALVRQRLGVGSAVHFDGWVHPAQSAFNAVDIVLHAATEEHFGRIFIEAMACGKPVIALRAGAAPEIIEDGESGILAEPGDATGLQRALIRLAADGALRQSMGARARCLAETRYAGAIVAREWDAYYARVRQCAE